MGHGAVKPGSRERALHAHRFTGIGDKSWAAATPISGFFRWLGHTSWGYHLRRIYSQAMVATLLLRLGPGGSPSHNRCDGRQHTSPQPQEAAKAASEVYSRCL